jgi:hypothetical protein
VVLTNYLRTSATSDSGTPHERVLEIFSFGFDPGTRSYEGEFAEGGTIWTFAESAGLTYTWNREDPGKIPFTIFGGPVATQSIARNLLYDYRISGTYGSGAQSYSVAGRMDRKLDVFLYGWTMGAQFEWRATRWLKVVPHIYEVILFSSVQRGTAVRTRTVTDSASPPPATTTSVFHARDSLGTIYFPVPGVDLVFTDWSLSFNLIEPFGGLIARTTAEEFLHGAWPLSLRLTKSFGPGASRGD